MEDTSHNYIREMVYDAPFTETADEKEHWHNSVGN